MAKATERMPFCKSCRSDFKGRIGREDGLRLAMQARLVNGESRNKIFPSLRCVADPDNCYLGSYFYEVELKKNLDTGVMPSGSLWLNDHDKKIYEIWGSVGEKQQLLVVDPRRIRGLEARFPRLRKALSSPTVY